MKSKTEINCLISHNLWQNYFVQFSFVAKKNVLTDFVRKIFCHDIKSPIDANIITRGSTEYVLTQLVGNICSEKTCHIAVCIYFKSIDTEKLKWQSRIDNPEIQKNRSGNLEWTIQRYRKTEVAIKNRQSRDTEKLKWQSRIDNPEIQKN